MCTEFNGVKKLRVLLVGGGNSTLCLGPLCAAAGHAVSVLTRKPDKWAEEITVRSEDPNFIKGMELTCKLELVTSDPALAIQGADIIWFAGVPIHHNPSLLRLIKPHLDPHHHVFIGTICCYGGFHWIVKKELGHGNYTPFGIQIIPWTCLTKEYGREAVIHGAKVFIRLATEGGRDERNLKKTLVPIFRCRVDDTSFLASVLWPNNSHFHPPILYGLFKDWDRKSPYDKECVPTYIYREMTDTSADSVQKFDAEVCKIIDALRLEFPGDPFLKLDYTLKACIEENYGDLIADKTDIASVIRTNAAYANHTVPYTSVGDGKVIPTVKHKFFETDVAFGLCLYRDIAQMVGVETPFIDELILWNQNLIGKMRHKFGGEYLKDGSLYGKDVDEAIIPSRVGMGISDFQDWTLGSTDTVGAMATPQ